MSLLALTVLIGLSGYRVWRLLALDMITDRLREPLEEGSLTWTFIKCPWCLGTWTTAAVWGVSWWQLEGVRAPWLVLGAALALAGTFGMIDKGWHERGS